MKTRLDESIEIMSKIYNQLHVPRDDPGAKELSRRLSDFVKNGKPWAEYMARQHSIIINLKSAVPFEAPPQQESLEFDVA